MLYCVTIDNNRYEVEVEKGNASIVSTTEIATRVLEDINLAYRQTAATTDDPKVVKSSEQITKIGQREMKEIIKAPMAGAITDIKVNVDSAVKKGDTLLLLEAMKMQNEITAHVDGIISEIKVVKGANVSTDDVLIVLE